VTVQARHLHFLL